MKLLTVGLVLVTAAMAGCSSTTGSSGAIQDEVPQGASCADGGVCVVGDSGPGGGVVFYASLTAFACGANMASKCNYLESAPNLWNPDSKISCKAATGTSCGGSVQETSDFSSTGLGFPWCTGSGGTASVNGATGTGIGAGFANTTAMLPVCNPGDAGNVARSYTGGGLTDWSLASKDELNVLYSYNNRAAIGGFNSGSYWSSSQGNEQMSNAQSFKSTGDKPQGLPKSTTDGVRPIRAF